MKSKRRIVIDASVARAAGDVSSHPLSTACRETLIAAEGLSTVFCPRMSIEWAKHESSFSRTWRVKMIQQGKVNFLKTDQEIEAFLAYIASTMAEEGAKSAMNKDAHLVSASIMNDKIVLALDEKVRTLFSKFCSDYKPAAKVLWANPGKPADGTIGWLRGGAKRVEARSLSSFLKQQAQKTG